MDLLSSSLGFIAAILVFPGLLFIFVGALLNQWYIRKLYARMQNRVGPKYSGPFGILQPFYDFFKLLNKESITPTSSRPRLFVFFIGIGIGSFVSLLMFMPFSPFRFQGPYDVIVFVYLGLWSTLALAFASLAFPSPFSTVGVSRLLSLLFVYEPTWIFSVLTPVLLASKNGIGFPFSILESVHRLPDLFENQTYSVLIILSLVAAVLSLQCKLGLQPFSFFDAETEIVAGVFTEFSGANLALASLFHDCEVFTYSILITFLFLAGAAPFQYGTLLGMLIIFIKFLAVVAALTVVRASLARYRVDKAINFFFKYPLLLSLAVLFAAILVS